MNSIEELLGVNTPKKDDTPKGAKFKSFKNKFTLYVKELKYPIVLLSSLTVIAVASNYTLLDEESEYSIKYMYGGGKSELQQMENDTHTFITNTNSVNNELILLNADIETKMKELDEANATITNLTQGYYFIAYLDSLFNKHNITLDRFDINLQSVGLGKDVITVNNLVDVQIPRGDYSLLPLDIEFTATSEGVRKLFNEFYTRRIVYDKNLQVINNLDNSVTVKTSIEFTQATTSDEVPAEPVVGVEGQLTTPVEQSSVEGQLDAPVEQAPVDDWDLSSSGNSQETPTSESTLGGTE